MHVKMYGTRPVYVCNEILFTPGIYIFVLKKRMKQSHYNGGHILGATPYKHLVSNDNTQDHTWLSLC